MTSLFQENVAQHAERLGATVRWTKNMRRAASVKRGNGDYNQNIKLEMQEMAISDIETQLGVAWDPGTGQYVSTGATLDADEQMKHAANHAFATYDDPDRWMVRADVGLPSSHLPLGYQEDAGGKIYLASGLKTVIAEAYRTAAEEGYTAAADVLNASALRRKNGKPWEKDSARDFFRLPAFAGYWAHIATPGNNLRGAAVFYPGSQERAIDLGLWIAANRRFVEDHGHEISFYENYVSETGFHPGDREAWEKVATARLVE